MLHIAHMERLVALEREAGTGEDIVGNKEAAFAAGQDSTCRSSFGCCERPCNVESVEV